MKVDLFSHGVALEENHDVDGALEVYKRLLAEDPKHASAHINIGTLYYQRHELTMAEHHYRAALDADPNYALAHFDLANVLDETYRCHDAIMEYEIALRLAPTYADAHYNLALAYERMREPRKALPHWRAYIKLDMSSPWATHARNQIKRILAADGLKLVVNNGPRRGMGTAKLFLVT
jgi:tetratricopeptide (TPR) repeat protein